MEIFCRTEYNYDRDKASVESGLRCRDVSLAKQEFAEESDINTIVKRFALTGQVPSGVRVPLVGDFTNAMDFRQSMDAIRRAQESFNAMPADVRAKFHNDPHEFVMFCEDKDNLPQLRKWGLAVPETAVQAAPAAAAAVPTAGAGAPPSTGST